MTSKKIDPERAGVIVGSGSGDLSIIRNGNINFVRGAYVLVANALPGLISKKFGFHGISKSVSAACATGSVALEEGYQRILNGDCDLVVVGSAEAPIDTPIFLGTEEDRRNGNNVLSIKNDIVNGMIPFDEKRDGPVLSEGAGILILESENHARDRGAHVYAEVVGCGTYTFFDENLVRITERGYEKAMIKALRSSGISDFSTTYVNAHGTATSLNDRVESRSIVNTFGDKVPVSSFKGTIGHALAAAPAIELIGCILALNKCTIPRSNLMNAAIDCAKLDL